MSKLTTLRRQSRRTRCVSCGKVIAKSDPRVVLAGHYVCSTCIYWAERGVVRIDLP